MRVLVKLFSYRNSPENPALWERSLWRSDAADYHGLEGLPWSCFVGERQWKIEAVVAMWVWGFELRFSGVVAWRREEKVKSVEKTSLSPVPYQSQQERYLWPNVCGTSVRGSSTSAQFWHCVPGVVSDPTGQGLIPWGCPHFRCWARLKPEVF